MTMDTMEEFAIELGQNEELAATDGFAEKLRDLRIGIGQICRNDPRLGDQVREVIERKTTIEEKLSRLQQLFSH